MSPAIKRWKSRMSRAAMAAHVDGFWLQVTETPRSPSGKPRKGFFSFPGGGRDGHRVKGGVQGGRHACLKYKLRILCKSS